MPHSTGSKALRNKLSSGLAPPRWRRPSALALAFLLALPSGAPPLYAQAAPDTRNALPSLGDSASEDFSVASERRLGERIMRDIRRDPDYLDDPVLLEYLQQLWGGLIAAARARGDIPAELDERFAWELFMVRDRTVNAFALPGGFVGVHLGLVAMTTAPDELASVLAHELSHVTQRHIARSVGAGKTSSLVGLAGLILGVLAASRSPEAAQALITGGQAVAVQGQLNYTRDFEREADRVGFGILTGAGHAPSGMAAMFERLQVASRLNDNQNFPYLRSHPLTSERIGEARSRLGVSGAAAPTAGRPLRYAMVRARARVLMDPREGSLQRVQDFEPAPALPALPASAAAADAAVPADRLAALYGSRGRFTLTSNEPRGVIASIEVPLQSSAAYHANLTRPAESLEHAPVPNAAPPKGWRRVWYATSKTHSVWVRLLARMFMVVMLMLAGLMLAGFVALITGWLPVQMGDLQLDGIESLAVGSVGLLIAFGAAALAVAIVVGVLYGLGFLFAAVLVFVVAAIVIGLSPVVAPFVLLSLAIWWVVTRRKL